MAAIEYPPPPEWARDFVTVGVTGTNGKTTTTLYTAAALSVLGSPIPNVTTLGHALDTEPVDVEVDYDGFLETMKRGHSRGGRHAVIECTSEALANGFMRAWPCQIAVFTNLSHDHLAQHGSPEHYLASKAQLFIQLPSGGVAVLNREDPSSALLAEIVPEHARISWYGVEPADELDFRLLEATPTWRGTKVSLGTQSGVIDFELHAIGGIFARNAIAALAAAVAAGADATLAAHAIGSAGRASGRFEVVSERPYAVVDYAHTPDALERTLETARALGPQRVTLVFGAGGDADREKRQPMGQVARRADRVIVTSDNPRNEDPRQIADDLCQGIGEHPDLTIELDRARAIELAITRAESDDLVLVTGKGHETAQIQAGEALPFSDQKVLEQALRRRS